MRYHSAARQGKYCYIFMNILTETFFLNSMYELLLNFIHIKWNKDFWKRIFHIRIIIFCHNSEYSKSLGISIWELQILISNTLDDFWSCWGIGRRCRQNFSLFRTQDYISPKKNIIQKHLCSWNFVFHYVSYISKYFNFPSLANAFCLYCN